MSLSTTSQSPRNVEDLRILRFEEVALSLGMSAKNLERIIGAGKGPKVTKLSTKNRGIRSDHLREWLDGRAEGAA